MNYTIGSGEIAYTVSTIGAELISAKNASGDEFIWQGNPEFWGDHAPLLFPVCGRLKNFYYMYEGKRYDMGIHGFLRRLEFDVVDMDDEHIVLRVSQNEETLKQYPFNFTVTVTYRADGCKLISSYFIKNDKDKVMPFAFGLHPGFNVFDGGDITIDDYKMIFDKSEVLKRMPLTDNPADPEFLPATLAGGEFELDNESIAKVDTIIFKNAGTHSRWVCEKSTHEIDMLFSDNLPLYCIWKNPSTDAHYVCLEPWTTEPARHVEEEDLMTRKNMIHLAPRAEERFLCVFTFKR